MKKKWFAKILLSTLLVGVALVGTTLAYIHASDHSITNDFTLAQVETKIEESGTTADEKQPIVVNSGKSPVYVRAKAIVISGEDSAVLVTEDDVVFTYDASWIDGGDGYYYYNQILQPGQNSQTQALFNGVQIVGEDVKQNENARFSVGVYHESALAPSSLPQGTDLVTAAKAAFSTNE